MVDKSWSPDKHFLDCYTKVPSTSDKRPDPSRHRGGVPKARGTRPRSLFEHSRRGTQPSRVDARADPACHLAESLRLAHAHTYAGACSSISLVLPVLLQNDHRAHCESGAAIHQALSVPDTA